MDSDNYDPLAPEDSPGRSAYVSKKDIKIIAIVLVALAAGLYPIYRVQVRKAQSAVCISNMKAIFDAVNMYAEYKDDHFPPIYRTGEGPLPGMGNTGKPYTWCDDVEPLMSRRYSFVCPAALPSEAAICESPTTLNGSLRTTYGMYYPYSAYSRSQIADPDTAIVFAETSNLGANGTYDPQKLIDSSGQVLPDGFVIGWNDSNTAPDSKTQYVTRLAYPGSASGIFSEHTDSRHDGGIHVLTASGELRLVPPKAARFEQGVGSFNGPWSPPLVTSH